MATPGKSEHEHLGWKIRITDKNVESEFSVGGCRGNPDPNPHHAAVVGGSPAHQRGTAGSHLARSNSVQTEV
jgi:hypothetical protein